MYNSACSETDSACSETDTQALAKVVARGDVLEAPISDVIGTKKKDPDRVQEDVLDRCNLWMRADEELLVKVCSFL